MAPPRIPLEDRFWRSVDKTGDCWNWTGGVVRHGLPYGRISLPGREAGQIFAHRLSYELHVGAIPSGAMVLHSCDNARCVNPAHLRLGTHAENMADRAARGRTARIGGEAHYAAKLTAAIARDIRRADGKHADIAAVYGIHKSHVSQIKRGKIWASA